MDPNRARSGHIHGERRKIKKVSKQQVQKIILIKVSKEFLATNSSPL